MSELFIVGLSHRTATVDVRESVAVPAPEIPVSLERILGEGFDDGVLVSTCNRVEFYGTAQDANAIARAQRALFGPHAEKTYSYRGSSAIRHAFRVASSLDSMVVGEPQILGQFKQAYELSKGAHAPGTVLDRCFTRSFAVAKRVRSETSIAEGAVSISSVATTLARRIFGELRKRRVVLVGAGEMGEAAAKALRESGAHLRVLNRSFAKAEALAERANGEAVPIERLAEELVNGDVVISSTSSRGFVLTASLMKDVVRARKRRPIFLIDIAVPRDIDPRVGELPNAFLYDVDDLESVANENIAQRRTAASEAERIVNQEVAEFEAWRRTLDLTPTIVALRDRVGELVEAEFARTLRKMNLSAADQKSLEKLQGALVNKFLHHPLTALREHGTSPAGPALIDATRVLFQVEDAADSDKLPESLAPGILRPVNLDE